MADSTHVSIDAAIGFIPFSSGSPQLRQLVAAMSGGGSSVRELFLANDELARQVDSMNRYIAQAGTGAFRQCTDGGQPYYVVSPPDGLAALKLRARFFEEPQSDPSTDVVYQVLTEQVIYAGSADGVRLGLAFGATGAAVVSSALATPICIAAMRSLAQAVSSSLQRTMRAPIEVELDTLAVSEADVNQLASQAAEASSAVEEAASASCATRAAPGLSFALLVCSVGLAVLEFLARSYAHRMIIHNFTDIDWHIQDLTVVHGTSAQVPYDKVIPRARLKTWGDGSQTAFVAQADYVFTNKSPYRGIGYVVCLNPKSDSQRQIGLLFDVPYYGDNSMYAGPLSESCRDFYSRHAGDLKATSRVFDLGDGISATLTFDALRGGDGQYASTVTIVDQRKYGAMLRS